MRNRRDEFKSQRGRQAGYSQAQRFGELGIYLYTLLGYFFTWRVPKFFFLILVDSVITGSVCLTPQMRPCPSTEPRLGFSLAGGRKVNNECVHKHRGLANSAEFSVIYVLKTHTLMVEMDHIVFSHDLLIEKEEVFESSRQLLLLATPWRIVKIMVSFFLLVTRNGFYPAAFS